MKNFNEIKNRINHLRSLQKLTADKKTELQMLTAYINDAEKQMNKASRVITRSTHGKLQQRSTGERIVRNSFGHAVGTIGQQIDTICTNPDLSGRYSKSEIATLCGTKVSKVNSHCRNELHKKYGYDFKVNTFTGKLEFIMPAKKQA